MTLPELSTILTVTVWPSTFDSVPLIVKPAAAVAWFTMLSVDVIVIVGGGGGGGGGVSVSTFGAVSVCTVGGGGGVSVSTFGAVSVCTVGDGSGPSGVCTGAEMTVVAVVVFGCVSTDVVVANVIVCG